MVVGALGRGGGGLESGRVGIAGVGLEVGAGCLFFGAALVLDLEQLVVDVVEGGSGRTVCVIVMGYWFCW